MSRLLPLLLLTAAAAFAAPAVVLHPAQASAPRDARAAWLDGRHVRWAAPQGAASVVLLASPTASLEVAAGRPPAGAEVTLPLAAAAEPTLAEPLRFSHVAGTAWQVAAADAARVPSLLRGQVVVAALDRDGNVLAATGLQLAGALDAIFGAKAAALEFGARPATDRTVFRLWAPTAREVVLHTYPSAQAAATETKPLVFDEATGAWSVELAGDRRGQFYTYAVTVFVPGLGVVTNEVTDPYSLSLAADSARSAVIDLSDPRTQPEGWSEDRRPDTVRAATDLAIYELHIRDFSRDDLTVPAAHRGKYLAFTHADTDGMRHLRALAQAGLTDVHLLPTYDLASIPERGAVVPELPSAAPDSPAVQAAIAPIRERDLFNWGYDPWHYTAPEGSYATDPDDAHGRVREFRAMVQALHRAGLRVGLDVVYNHTMAAGQDRQSVLDRIVPGYYHRLNAGGGVESSTCCSNTATEAVMMAKLMIDSSVVWARDYRIDSFRFDLMGHQPREAMLRLQAAVDAAAGRRIHLIGEGWNFGEVANGARFVQAAQLTLQHSGIGIFSDRMRDAARGGRAGDRREELFAQGWLNGLSYAPNAVNAGKDSRAALASAADLIRVGLAGSVRSYVLRGADGVARPLADFRYGDQPAGYVVEPGEVVNYTENHDNQTLFDNNVHRLPADIPRHDRARVQVLGSALVLFSQGIAYLHAGQEILRSKSLDRNSYNSGDAFNRVDWTLTTNHFGLGLPPAWDNEDSWPVMRPFLARAAEIAPAPEDIRFTFAATRDLLRIRAESVLFRLHTAADIRKRLRFLNTGPDAVHSVVAARLDGRGLDGAKHGAILYAINADVVPRTLDLPDERGVAWSLHPVLASPDAGDPRAREARFDAATGRLVVPARTAVVFVRP